MFHRSRSANTDKVTAADPVCGMTVNPAKAAASAEYNGTAYYFCSAHCAAAFTADPAKYIGS